MTMRQIPAAVHNWNDDDTRAEREIANVAVRSGKGLRHTGKYGPEPDADGRDWFLERMEHLCHRYGAVIQIEPHEQLTQIPARITRQFLARMNL